MQRAVIAAQRGDQATALRLLQWYRDHPTKHSQAIQELGHAYQALQLLKR